MKRVSTVTVRKRLSYILIAGLFIFFIIDVRLGYVQFGMGKMLTERARDSWSRNIPFEPERGNILDRNGIPIAANQSAPTVFVIPRQIEQAAEAAEKLAPVLNMSKEKLYKQGLQNALNTGSEILKKGGTALDAVEATIKVLEDDSLFNAGKGAVFTNEGKNERRKIMTFLMLLSKQRNGWTSSYKNVIGHSPE